jgi:hypothetical protein
MIWIRLAVYLITFAFALAVTIILEIPRNNGAKVGIRFMTWPLTITWFSLVVATIAKAADIGHGTWELWLFVMAGVVTTAAMIGFLRWLRTNGI